MESFLVNVRRRLLDVAADLLPFFEIYAGEARFGASVIESDLQNLSSGSQILEVGAGILLLSCHLQRKEYAVTAVEPVSREFSFLDRLRKIVMDCAREGGFAPALFTIHAEDMEFASNFDYAFSINVMEHVGDVATVLHRVFSAIRPGGLYRFLCPNYLFPYEPHFNMPTLFSKALTKRLFGKHIRSSQSIEDPDRTWTSLNWISVPQVRRVCRNELGVEPLFDRSVLYRFIQRALRDNEFQKRRGALTLRALQALDKCGMTRLLMRLPAVCQPAMNCVIVRT